MPDTSVVALAGRRIDAENAETARFPLSNVGTVRRHLAEMLRNAKPVALVSSAACGSDLIALEEAASLGIRRRIVLAFPRDKFLTTSVIDRPGEWKSSFERLTAIADKDGDLIILGDNDAGGDALYAAVNDVIVSEAKMLAQTLAGAPHKLVAAIVWEGQPRPGNDITNNFKEAAVKSGFETEFISTM